MQKSVLFFLPDGLQEIRELSLLSMSDFFCFLALFLKDFYKYALTVSFQKIDPDLGAVTIGAELQGHVLCVVDVATCVARMCPELGPVDLGANYYDAELGANCYGTELWKLINLNFYHDLDIKK